jgi:Arm DNA-binding domain/Phage integrase central domain
MPKKKLTDRTVKALKAAPAGKRLLVHDTEVSGFAVRVTDQGVRTFVLLARYPGAKWAAPRAIGTYPETTLEKARETARTWRQLIREGVDPAIARAEVRRANERRQADTFATVAEAWLGHIKRLKQSKAAETERDISREFIPLWGVRPITSITHRDVTEAIEAVMRKGTETRPHIAQAHNLLGELRRLFAWAVTRGAYDLQHSPCERIRPTELIGERVPRDRVLSADELRAFWRATGKMGYPYGPLLRLLLLTLLRRDEVGQAPRSEFGHAVIDETSTEKKLFRDVWLIPAERMKSGYAHSVPFLFSTTHGAKPVNGYAQAKVRLDRLMLDELRALAQERAEDPAAVHLEQWTFHDLRRTGRTHLATLPVPENVAELVIAHAKRGLQRVYDQHRYLEEKRRALELWAARLRNIVEPAPDNVVDLPASGSLR